MALYWIIFGYAALMALTFPIEHRERLAVAHGAAMLLFLLGYVVLATMRYEIGGDWKSYQAMYEETAQVGLIDAVTNNDPLFGAILWALSHLQFGVYVANGLCAALMALGVVRVGLTTRDPWLAIVMAIPYLLIVVGMGYVRQAGAIGLLMLAVTALNRRHYPATIGKLVLAAGFHSTSGIALPIFGLAMAPRRRWLSIILAAVGLTAFAYLFAMKFSIYQVGYLENKYNSSGAVVRLAMNAMPATLLLLRWRHFPIVGPARTIWSSYAVLSLATLIILRISPSSTAIDRLSLYFAPVQIIVCGTIRDLFPVRRMAAYPVRMMVVAVAAAVQIVWLMFADNAYAWVPYRSVLDAW
jgi:hypothetical protein